MARTKLVVAWIDNDGLELTGRYRDRYQQQAEVRPTLRAKACVWGDPTPQNRERLERYIKDESHNHLWMGFYELTNSISLLARARSRALDSYQKAAKESLTKASGTNEALTTR